MVLDNHACIFKSLKSYIFYLFGCFSTTKENICHKVSQSGRYLQRSGQWFIHSKTHKAFYQQLSKARWRLFTQNYFIKHKHCHGNRHCSLFVGNIPEATVSYWKQRKFTYCSSSWRTKQGTQLTLSSTYRKSYPPSERWRGRHGAPSDFSVRELCIVGCFHQRS